MRRALPGIIFLLSWAAAVPTDTLGPLARRFLETGSPAAREALLHFADGDGAAATPSQAPLAYLVLGIGDLQAERFAPAARDLAQASKEPFELADYAVYYHALALSGMGDYAGAARTLAGFHKQFPSSPLGTVALIQRAQSLSLSSQAREALDLLSAAPHSTASSLLLLAQVAERAGELVRAAETYQRIYYEFPAAPEAKTALTALSALRLKLHSRYPEPSPELRLGRADKLAAAAKHLAARAEYRTLSLRLKGLPREQAAVRVGVCDYHLNATLRAYRWLKALRVTAAEADAERLYYIGACARRLKRAEEFAQTVARLGREHSASRWHAEALFWLANQYWVDNAPEQYLPLYRRILELFPKGRYASTAQWRIAWRAYEDHQPDAQKLLEDHIRLYPESQQITAAVYWLGRLAESKSDLASALACYQYLTAVYPNYYYGLQALERLQKLPRAAGPATAPPPHVAELLAAIPRPPAPPQEPPAEWKADLGRVQLLDRLGLSDLAQRELRYRADSPALAYPAALELSEQAAASGNYHQAIRYLKHYTPGYLAFPVDSLPRRYWELLFPMPWRNEIESYSKLHELDPSLVAA
ncbi:MAG TPA: tetratricopeptide repeat protein, partial [Bryobacterales bacterium]|nr:tetratricopeptide repeat protein [Bryobacterales bacterium]